MSGKALDHLTTAGRDVRHYIGRQLWLTALFSACVVLLCRIVDFQGSPVSWFLVSASHLLAVLLLAAAFSRAYLINFIFVPAQLISRFNGPRLQSLKRSASDHAMRHAGRGESWDGGGGGGGVQRSSSSNSSFASGLSSAADNVPAGEERANPLSATLWSKWVDARVRTPDGETLDAAMHILSTQDDVPAADQRWVLWFNANGVSYEENMRFCATLSRELGCNTMAVNFRGVGNSSGRVLCEADLLNDGRGAFCYLLDRGVLSKNILLHGHSLGGAVAAKVRKEWPDGPVISDRSFGSLIDVVESRLADRSFGAVVGGIVGVVVSALVAWNQVVTVAAPATWLLHPAANALLAAAFAVQLHNALQPIMRALVGHFFPNTAREMCVLGTEVLKGLLIVAQLSLPYAADLLLWALPPLAWVGLDALAASCVLRVSLWWQLVLLGETAGVAAGLLRVVPHVMLPFVKCIGWEMNVVDVWKELPCPKAVVYHPQDAMIPLEGGSLYGHVGMGGEGKEGSEKEGGLVVRLEQSEGAVGNVHMYPLNFDADEWEAFIGVVQSMWGED